MSENTQQEESQPQDGNAEGGHVLSAATLHDMQEESDRLAADMDEARTATQAALQADSLAGPGERDVDVVANARPHGDAPVGPNDDNPEP